MKKQILSIFVIFSLIIIIPNVNAQEFSFGEKANQKSITVTISDEGNVHVQHLISSSNISKQVELIYGTVSNLSVKNEVGKEVDFSIIGNNEVVIILPSNENSIIEYELDHVLNKKDEIWTWSFRYLETTSFIFPESVNFIFSNDRPIKLGDKKGITCHGCQMILEYVINEPKIVKKVIWEDKEFFVEIHSFSNIENFVFNQSTKSISLDFLDENMFITILIPLELLWEPYTVFQNDEKIFFHQYINNGTHVWVNMKPENSGEITIIGTTVIPEFPIFAPLAIGLMAILVMPFLRKFNLH